MRDAVLARYYAQLVLDWYRDNNAIVLEDVNSPNSSEYNHIEIFWAIMNAKFRKTAKVLENELALRKQWVSFMSYAQNFMSYVKGK